MIVLYQVCTVVDVPPQLQSALAMLIAASNNGTGGMDADHKHSSPTGGATSFGTQEAQSASFGPFSRSVRNLGSGRECDGTVSRAHACDFLQMYEELNKVTRQIVHESNWRNVGLTILTRASAQERLRFLASSRVFGLDEMEAIQ